MRPNNFFCGGGLTKYVILVIAFCFITFYQALLTLILCARFHISHISIIRYKTPLLVMLVFFYRLYKNGGRYVKLTNDVIKSLDRFFITSQLNSWDLQSYTDNFTKIIKMEEGT